jgi:mono/diheme cytochrome c family protein
MRTRPILTLTALAGLAAVALMPVATSRAEATRPAKAGSKQEQIARGKYLVTLMVCNDCHTPFKVGPKGPEPDMTRMLSGHPQDLTMPAPPAPNGPWVISMAGTNTAFAGPWGVSFTANLTPDPETGLGKWNADTFMQALRTGKHEGVGRPILPPMPYPWFAQATDEDLRAIFAYLQSIPPVKNKVPQPIEPPEAE